MFHVSKEYYRSHSLFLGESEQGKDENKARKAKGVVNR